MEVELIKAHDSFDGSARRKIERLRVAAYCRVSTDDEDQIKSYNSRTAYCTRHFSKDTCRPITDRRV